MGCSSRPGATVSVEPLEYKQDWPESRERFLAFWEHDIIDRACIHVTAPRENQIPLPEVADAETQISDIDLHLALMNAYFKSTYFGGEAIPTLSSILAFAVYGGEPIFMKSPDPKLGMIWIDPIIKHWGVDSYRFDPDNAWCQHFLELKRREYEDSRGKYLPACGGLLWPTDMLSLFRGTTQLCLDLVDHPDHVRETVGELMSAFKWICNQRFDIVHAEEEGNTLAELWAPGRFYGVGCDFSCLISSEHYRDFVLPEIVELTQWFDYSLYHLDGPGALQHLSTLLEIEDLNCVQFVPGEAHKGLPALHWFPLYKQIQEAGKLVLIYAEYGEVQSILETLDPRGLFIVTSAPSIEAAEDLLHNAEHWSCRGLHTGVQPGDLSIGTRDDRKSELGMEA